MMPFNFTVDMGILRIMILSVSIRDAKIVEIYEGTKEIEKNTIAREILGKTIGE